MFKVCRRHLLNASAELAEKILSSLSSAGRASERTRAGSSHPQSTQSSHHPTTQSTNQATQILLKSCPRSSERATRPSTAVYQLLCFRDGKTGLQLGKWPCAKVIRQYILKPRQNAISWLRSWCPYSTSIPWEVSYSIKLPGWGPIVYHGNLSAFVQNLNIIRLLSNQGGKADLAFQKVALNSVDSRPQSVLDTDLCIWCALAPHWSLSEALGRECLGMKTNGVNFLFPRVF